MEVNLMRRAMLLLMFNAGAACAGATDLTWLAGTWCGDDKGTLNEEVWLAPRAGSLVGAHRDTRGDALRGFEFFRIVEDGDALVYWAQPGGKVAVAFRGKPAGQSIDFVNPQHDFPKRIRYRRDGDTLYARIDDGTDTGPRHEWTWRRNC
jgi:hypothetical protein